ncbi:MAG: hypothetical protein ACYS7Y_11905 [Planctomycetota bacterium]|jgi:hypothetical protein
MSIIGRPLKDIVDDLERLNAECRQWYREHGCHVPTPNEPLKMKDK